MRWAWHSAPNVYGTWQDFDPGADLTLMVRSRLARRKQALAFSYPASRNELAFAGSLFHLSVTQIRRVTLLLAMRKVGHLGILAFLPFLWSTCQV
jgi:hypothetical protein